MGGGPRLFTVHSTATISYGTVAKGIVILDAKTSSPKCIDMPSLGSLHLGMASITREASQPVARTTLAQRPMHPEGSLIYAGPATEAAGPPPVTEGVRAIGQPAFHVPMAIGLAIGS